MEKKYKRIPFDLELAKAITKGEKEGRVVMRTNKPIRLISFSIDNRFCPILGITNNLDGTNTAYQFTIDGSFFATKQTSANDLFLEVPDEQEFKDGNVVTFNFGGAARIAIIKRFTGCKLFYPYVELVLCTKYLAFGGQSLFEDIRLATEEERQTLIDALKKDNSDKARKYLKRFFGIETPKFNYGSILSAPYIDGERIIIIYTGTREDDNVNFACAITTGGEYLSSMFYKGYTAMRDFQPATEEEKQKLKEALENDKDNQVAAYNILATFFG